MIKLLDLLKGIIRDPLSGEIYEGLLITTPIETALKIIERNFQNNEKFLSVENKTDKLIITFKINNESIEVQNALKYTSGINLNSTIISDILRLLNNLGYFPAHIVGFDSYKEYKLNDSDVNKKYSYSELKKIINELEYIEIVSLIFEKKYDEKIKLPPKLYHITDSIYLEKIKKVGLTPKTKSKTSTHPERVYFSLDEKDTPSLWKNLKIFISNKGGILLTIDTQNLNLNLYKDPNFSMGAYTYENIPPQNIIQITPIKE